MTQVKITGKALKQLRKAPEYIKAKLDDWVDAVEEKSLLEVRKSPGYHDEPLQGERKGQRSIRLNRKWRAIYIEINETIEIEVIEVNAHDY